MATYSTLGIFQLIFLTFLLFFGPGYVWSRYVGFSRTNAIGIAPPVSIALICILSALPHLETNELLVVGLTLGAGVYSTTRSSKPMAKRKDLPWNHLAFGISGFLLLTHWRWPLSRAWTNGIPQSTDSVWHGYLISMIRDFGLNGPGNTVRVDGALGGSYAYQYGAHSIPGLLAGKGIFGVTTAMNLSMFFAFFVILPISAFILFRLLTGRSFLSFSLTVVLLILPNVVDTGFHLYSFGIATALFLPVLLISEIHFKGPTIDTALLLAFSLLGIFLVHNSLGLFAFLMIFLRGLACENTLQDCYPRLKNCSLLLMLFSLVFFFRRTGSLFFTAVGFIFILATWTLNLKRGGVSHCSNETHVRQSTFKKFSLIPKFNFYISAVGVPTGIFMFLSSPWVFEANQLVFDRDNGDVISSRVNQLSSVRKPKFATLGEYFEALVEGRSVLTPGYNTPITLMLILLILLIGLRRRMFPVLASVGLIGYSAIATSVDGMWARNWFGGIWLGDAYRAASVFEICLIVALGYTLRSGASKAVGSSTMSNLSNSGPGSRNLLVTGLATALVVVSLASVMQMDSREGFHDYFLNWENERHAKTVSRGELEGYLAVAAYVPPGSRVLNYFGDGSPWIYPATGASVVSVWGEGSVSPSDRRQLLQSIEIAIRDFDVLDLSTLESNIQRQLQKMSVCALFVGSGNVNTSESQWVLAMKDPKANYFFSMVDSQNSDEYEVWLPREDLRPSQCDLGAF